MRNRPRENQPPDDHPLDDQANAYLDGDLSPADRAAFEMRLEREPELRASVEAWREIESGIDRVFTHQPPPAMPARAAHKAGSKRTLGLAAAVLLLVGAMGVLVSQWTAGPDAEPPPNAAVLYAGVTASFEPKVVCDTPEKFARYTREHLGVRVTAHFDQAEQRGITLLGWDTVGGAYTPEERASLPRVLLALGPGGEKIVVYFQTERHPAPVELGDAPINVFSTEMWKVTAFELTPLDRAIVLDLLCQ